MTVDPTVIPGLLLLVGEFGALSAVGYVIARVALQQANKTIAMAQGLVVGLAIWGLIVNFALAVAPGQTGAAVGWVLFMAMGIGLAARSPHVIRVRPRLAIGFAVSAIALCWAALASRQIGSTTDPLIHVGLAASIRAGGFPPELPWAPGLPAPYHYGPSLLVGLLAPPAGPDLAFVSELLGVYAWAGFALVVVTALWQRGSWPVALVLAPLLLTSGLWTFASAGQGILQLPVPTGLPEAGLRASLAEVYWPAVELSPTARFPEAIPDISKPAFTLAYALVLVVLERSLQVSRWSWRQNLTLAALVGFLGLLSATLAPLVLLLWAGIAAMRVARDRRRGSILNSAVQFSAGPVLAGLLLLLDWGVFTGILGGAGNSGFTTARDLDSTHWESLGTFRSQPGGIGLLGLGPVLLAASAVVLAPHQRLVVTLAASAGLMVIAWLGIDYPTYPLDLNRLAGHARNFALVALLLALSARLATLPTHWRRTVTTLLVGLMVWPTVVAPVRSLALSLERGVQLANANAVQRVTLENDQPEPQPRFQLPAMSAALAAYIRDHTAVDARILTPGWPFWTVTFATGRPSSAGFLGLTHLIFYQGPEYWDALNYLEPAAFRRLGIEYIHSTDSWIATLSPRSRDWLTDPELFELLIRDGAEALFRVRPAFLELDIAPHPESFEALRSVPPTTSVYLTPQTLWLNRLRIASVLAHTRLVGAIDTEPIHLRSREPWTVEPLGSQVPDLVVLPASIESWTWMFPPDGRQPIWQNSEIAIYAPKGALAPITPGATRLETPPLSVHVSQARVHDGRITFTTTYDEHAPDRWTGQDWVIVKTDDGPWEMPSEFLDGGRGPAITKWFAGLISPGAASPSHTYELDTSAAMLAVRDEAGNFVPLESSDGDLDSGTWVLALRLQHEWRANYWREVAFIPVLTFRIGESGEVTYEAS